MDYILEELYSNRTNLKTISNCVNVEFGEWTLKNSLVVFRNLNPCLLYGPEFSLLHTCPTDMQKKMFIVPSAIVLGYRPL